MSISDTITSIENHLSADYEGLTNLGVDLTGINKNIENIKPCLDTIYNSLPKVSDTGTEVTLSPTLKGKLGIVEKGNSTQESTNGYQLLNSANFSADGITATMVGGHVTMSGKALTTVNVFGAKRNLSWANLVTGNTYTLSVSNSTTTNIITGIGFYDSNDTLVSDYQNVNNGNGTKTFTIPATATKLYFFIQVVNGQTYNDTLDVMIESGSTAHTWETYTGGIPAPNPSFPIPIKSVTGNNNVVVNNKNICSSTSITNTNQQLRFYFDNKLLQNEFTLSFKTDKDLSNQTLTIYNATTSSNVVQFTGSATGLANTKISVTKTLTNEQLESIKNSSDTFYMVVYKSNAGFSSITEAQIENNSTNTTYEAYTQVTKPLNLGNIELNKIGTYQDYIYKNNGNWYKHEEIGKTILGNVTQVRPATDIFGVQRKYVVYTINDMLSTLQKEYNFICNLVSPSNNVATIYTGYHVGKAFVVIVDDNDTIETVNQKFANGILYYVKNTAQDIEITDSNLISQLEEIDKMQSYNGTTIITSTYDSNNAQMILQVSSLKGE